ncbi:hypothetical protein [uncultured Oxalicibacterium sp.]|uniref:hypothetical protein n=1 Tax=uncultured Oxalicibacterium sp. TaxID=1168540 RepID=UPI0025DE1D82|nr:hypothetical protein [uncultured Oxalicibacterium sp.]
MKKTAQATALISALFFSAGVMAQTSNSEVVTKPAPSTESKAPMAHGEKSRSEVRHDAQGAPVGTLKPGNSTESRAPDGGSMKTRDQARHDDAKMNKRGTTKDGMNEPDNAYPKDAQKSR